MNRIWAPWRKAYIRAENKKNQGCVFCRLLKSRRDRPHYLLQRNRFCFAVLNLYPYNNGHVLIVPNRHVDSLGALTDAEKLDWLSLHEEVMTALKKALRPHGFNVGMNLGPVAGAGIPHHLHSHIVPRWKGDSNFMPVVAETKVISESLDSVYQALSCVLKRSRGKKRPR